MQQQKIIKMLKAFTAAALLLSATAQAALTGDVIVNGLAALSGSGSTFTVSSQVTAVGTGGDFSNFLPTLETAPPALVTISGIILNKIGPIGPGSEWSMTGNTPSGNVVIDFGIRTMIGDPTPRDLTFTVFGNQSLYANVNPTINNFSFIRPGVPASLNSSLNGVWTFGTTTVGEANLAITRNENFGGPGSIQFAISSVPEPATYLAGLGTLGMLGLFGWRRRR